MDNLERLRDQLRTFAAERDWDQFHSPKNLSAALAVEAAELLEKFQWLTEAESHNLPPDARTIDVSGCYLTPGWVDIHVHVYGTLGFADPDSIGVCQGVTTYVEAGGPGIDTLDEFLATAGKPTP